MSDGRIRFVSGVPLGEVNSRIIPAFLENLVSHSSYEGIYRPLDATKFHKSVAEFLTDQQISVRPTSGFDGFGFRIEPDRESAYRKPQADVVNRTIVLANKVLVSNRETDIECLNYEGIEVSLNDAIDGTLAALHPFTWKDIVDFGSRVSYVMKVDKRKNVFPTLVKDGFLAAKEWHSRQPGNYDFHRWKNSTDAPDSTLRQYREKLSWVIEGAMDAAKKYGERHIVSERERYSLLHGLAESFVVRFKID